MTPAQIQIIINSMQQDRTFEHQQLANICFGRVDLMQDELKKTAIINLQKYIKKIDEEKQKIEFRLPMLDEYNNTLTQILQTLLQDNN